GWAPWPWDTIQHCREHAPSHLWEAAALALYTGQRLSHVLVMRWSDIDQGHIHRELAALLATLKARLLKNLAKAGRELDLRRYHEPILLNSRNPWTTGWLQGVVGKRDEQTAHGRAPTCRLVFHGLRKSAVVFLLEAGCTDAETAAIVVNPATS